jgi:ABC-type branched-subunit amino acid transport system substrate-binding protein
VRDNATADGGLQIKVLLVSDGLQGAGWATAVADIQRAVASQHVAVVAGLGVSIASTMSAVLKLTRGRSAIPVVGSSITSDAYDNIKNLVRVSPSNTDDVDEALAYIKPRFRTAVLVEDTNPADSYDQTLIREFSRGFPDRTHAFVDHEPYNTGIPGAATAFPQIAADICTAKHSAVLFAGRGKNLATLISALADQCEDQPVTIITGDDVVDMSMSPTVSSGLREHVTLDYAGTASPDEWSGSAADVTVGRAGFDTFRQAFEQHFSSASFADGSAMTGYDATLTSIAAIRLTRNLHPSPAEVVQVIGQLKGSRKVLGATGPIALSADYGGSAKTGSNPVQKAIPILQLEPSGSVRFLELDWSPTVAGELGEAGLVP